MKENKFLDKISKDANDPMIRYYKEIKIKIVTEKHFFEIEQMIKQYKLKQVVNNEVYGEALKASFLRQKLLYIVKL